MAKFARSPTAEVIRKVQSEAGFRNSVSGCHRGRNDRLGVSVRLAHPQGGEVDIGLVQYPTN